MTASDHARVLRFLQDPESYGVAGETVSTIETHCAVVFLIGARAYKLKKPVRFAYLDFSTVGKRREAIAREFALNKRTAPALYLGVVSITVEPDGALALDGKGEVVDWLLVMERFDQDDRLDNVALRGGLNDALIDDLADAVRALHGNAEVLPGGSNARFGGAAGLARILASNEAELEQMTDTVFAPSQVDAVVSGCRAEHARLSKLLDARRDGGLVRRCHGDLHLGNVCLVDGRPVLYDCIEFSDDFACIDVLYDLAFLLMDLVHRGLGGAANRVLNRYLERASVDDVDAILAGLDAMPLFLALRATVRAHVEGRMAAKDQAKLSVARAYLGAAQDHLATTAPKLVAIGGLSGSGKSTVARALAPSLGRATGALVLRSDVIRKQLFGVAPEAKLTADAYASAVSERVYGKLFSQARRALDAGETVILDAVFSRPADRMAAEDVANQAGVSFDGIWLQADRENLTARVGRRVGDASDADAAVVAAQLLEDVGPLDWFVQSADGTPDEVVHAVKAALGVGTFERGTA